MKKKQDAKVEDYTVVIIKPDGVRKRVTGEIITRFERVGLKLVASKLIWVNDSHIGQHYQDNDSYHKIVGEKTLENYQKYGFDAKENLGTDNPIEVGRLVRKWNMEFMSSGPVLAMLWEGPGAVPLVRKIVGFTFPSDAVPGTIRGDYAIDSAFHSNVEKRSTQNLIHASGNKEEAEFEKKLWFHENEIYSY